MKAWLRRHSKIPRCNAGFTVVNWGKPRGFSDLFSGFYSAACQWGLVFRRRCSFSAVWNSAVCKKRGILSVGSIPCHLLRANPPTIDTIRIKFPSHICSGCLKGESTVTWVSHRALLDAQLAPKENYTKILHHVEERILKQYEGTQRKPNNKHHSPTCFRTFIRKGRRGRLDPSVRTVVLYKELFGLHAVDEVTSSVRKPISEA